MRRGGTLNTWRDTFPAPSTPASRRTSRRRLTERTDAIPFLPRTSWQRFSVASASAPARRSFVYDQDDGRYASRLWWMLRYMGHEAVAVLDGGWARWTREGRPVAAARKRVRATRSTGDRSTALRLRVDEVERLIGDPDTLLVDARAPERFEGRHETLDRVAGHIPGAANYFYQWNVRPDGTMLPPEQLREQFDKVLGGHRPQQVVMYCGSGRHRLPEPARHGARRPSRRADLPGLVVRVVERSRAPDRERGQHSERSLAEPPALV